LSGSMAVLENSLVKRLIMIKEQDDLNERNKFIQDYIPFIIKAVSNQTNRYIEIENSDEFSIGLIAFNEAIEKYDHTKGGFLNFAELVIKNRVKDLCRKRQKERLEISLENCIGNSPENMSEPYCEIDHESIALNEEIEQYETELRKFGITFEDLVTETPKHRDTRENAIQLSERISKDQTTVKEIYAKKKLPISKIVLKFKTTVKIVKRSKKFILSTVIIFVGNFCQLRLWVKNSLQGERNV